MRKFTRLKISSRYSNVLYKKNVDIVAVSKISQDKRKNILPWIKFQKSFI